MSASSLQSSTESRVNADHRLITEQTIQHVYDRVRSFQTGDGVVGISIDAWWRGSMRWARNRVSLGSDQRDLSVSIVRGNDRGIGAVQINQIDDESLKAAVRAAERKMNVLSFPAEFPFDWVKILHPALPFPETAIWSDATFNVTPETRAQLAQTLLEDAESHQLLSAGFLQMNVAESQRLGRFGLVHNYKVERELIPTEELPKGTGGDRTARQPGYQLACEAQCSMTVRHPKGVGSGWAGVSGYDWSVLDPKQAARISLEKCLASLNPVAIEPGRYTVIMEPQATATFASKLVGSLQTRLVNERLDRIGPWSMDIDPALQMRMTKLGLKVIDERISISHQPMDPQLGVIPSMGLQDITWIEDGVLKALGHRREEYSVPVLQDNLPVQPRGSYKMTGGTTTMEEMIATTERGIIVTRFSHTTAVPGAGATMLLTGLTRDGLWLVENGKVSKAIKNMRFTDSPLFVFNQIEQLGTPVPIFAPGLTPAIVPSIKSRDFAFTATIDAI